MGSTCYACQSCGENTCEFVLGDFYLEPYQNHSKNEKKLSKYDRFYRVVCDPFHRLHISEFMMDLDILITNCEIEFEKNNPGQRYNLEHIPYVKYLEYFRKNNNWQKYINNVESPFMRLLQIDELFYCKTVVSSGVGATPREKSDEPSPVRNIHFDKNTS